MAVRKTRTKRRVKRSAGKIVMIRAGRGAVYIAPLSALGRPVRNAKLNRLLAAYGKKAGTLCYADFCGIFTRPMFLRAFGNGNLPD